MLELVSVVDWRAGGVGDWARAGDSNRLPKAVVIIIVFNIEASANPCKIRGGPLRMLLLLFK
jgi:hypothetical protein